jgi:hypothetical protein
VWQRPGLALPLDVVEPADDDPLVTGAAEEDDDALVVAARLCDVLAPSASEIEPWKEQPARATSANAGRSGRPRECLTAPTLETSCDRGPVFVFPFRDVVRRI